MKLDDPRIEVRRIHNQDIYLPSSDAWEALVAGEPIGDSPVALTEWVRSWLDEFAKFEVARLGLRRWRGGWLLVPLLRMSGDWYRVHFEDVICEHCESRCGPSATPDATAYAGTGLSLAELSEEFARLAVHQCPHCQGLLRRRQTIWLAATDP